MIRLPCLRNLFEFGGSETPATNGQQDLKLRIPGLEADDSLVETFLSVGRCRDVVGLERRQLAVLDPSEGKDDVRA